MRRLARRPAPVVLILALMSGATPVRAQAPPATPPIPEVTGPVPITATSFPLMMSSRLQTVVDLPKAGYVEEEFLVSSAVPAPAASPTDRCGGRDRPAA